MQTINRYKTASDACLEVAKRLAELAKTGGNVALSGGDTPKLLFRIMADQFPNTDWSKLHFFWGDERMVPATSDESNYGVFFRELIATNRVNQAHVFPITYFANEEKSLDDYHLKLREQLPFQDGFPQFDLILLGVGNDGHIASIFPDNLESFSSKEIAQLVMHPLGQQQRITLTGSTLNHAKTIYILATGDHKSDILESIITHKNQALPATHITQPTNIVWFIDEAAAAKL